MLTILNKQFVDAGIRELILKDDSVKNLKMVWNHLRKNKIQFNARVEFRGPMRDCFIESKQSTKLSDFLKDFEICSERFLFKSISFFVEEKEIDKINLQKSYSNYTSSPKPWIN